MECKFCHAQMDEGETLCPVCGKDNGQECPEEVLPETIAEEVTEVAQEEAPAEAAEDVTAEEGSEEAEETPAEDEAGETASAEAAPAEEIPAVEPPKKKKTGLIAGIAVAAAVVIGLALFFVLRGGSGKGMGTTDISAKESYTVEDSKLKKSANKVVARMGDKDLTVSQFQIFYWMEYYNFLSNYNSMISYFGLDTTLPLDQQESMEEGKTWQQYFMESALSNWQQFQSLCIEAEAAGYVLPEDMQAKLDGMEEGLTTQAASNGYATVDEMVQTDFGAGATFQDYLHYMELYYTAYMYFNEQYAALDPTEEELNAYYESNAAAFAEQGIVKDETPATIDVRHILISPEGGTTDETGSVTYSDEEWAAAADSAIAIYETWKAGDMTEDTFAALAEQHSVDGGSNTNGGLYTDVHPGEMVTEFNDWCFDLSREPGDTAIVRTKFGYHIMYFVSASEDYYWQSQVLTEYLNEKGNELLTSAADSHPMEVNYKAIVLGLPKAMTEDTTEPTETVPADTAAPTETTEP